MAAATAGTQPRAGFEWPCCACWRSVRPQRYRRCRRPSTVRWAARRVATLPVVAPVPPRCDAGRCCRFGQPGGSGAGRAGAGRARANLNPSEPEPAPQPEPDPTPEPEPVPVEEPVSPPPVKAEPQVPAPAVTAEAGDDLPPWATDEAEARDEALAAEMSGPDAAMAAPWHEPPAPVAAPSEPAPPERRSAPKALPLCRPNMPSRPRRMPPRRRKVSASWPRPKTGWTWSPTAA